MMSTSTGVAWSVWAIWRFGNHKKWGVAGGLSISQHKIAHSVVPLLAIWLKNGSFASNCYAIDCEKTMVPFANTSSAKKPPT